jgi:hemerythrin
MSTGWDPSMATSVPQVDSEHQEWFRQADRLNQALMEGKGRDEIEKILNFVGDYVVTHFAHEEKIMADYSCSVADANKAAHTKFIGRYMELQSRYAQAGASSSLAIEIHDLLKKWLIEHITHIDIHLLPCANSGKQTPSPAMSK